MPDHAPDSPLPAPAATAEGPTTSAGADERRSERRRAGWTRSALLVERAFLPTTRVDELRGWVDEVEGWAIDGSPGIHHREATEHGPVAARSEFFADVHEGLGAFVRSGELQPVLTGLFGEEPVLFKEKINYKHAGGGGFAPHQDAAAYRFIDHHISVMVPLDAATVRSGCLWFAPDDGGATLPTDDRGRIETGVVDTLAWEPVEVEPGDVVFFDSYMPHFSETNLSDHSRRAMYLTYNAAGRGDYRAAYYADKLDEFAREGDTFDADRVRISISDDFLGRPV